MERVVKKSRSFRAAERWDIRQNLSLTPGERIRIAHALRKRVYWLKPKTSANGIAHRRRAGFSGDIREFIRLLAQWKVRYLIVGGEAVIYHGYPRITGDVDFFYGSTVDNAHRLFQALEDFWGAGRVPALHAAAELLEPGLIVQFGRPPHRIDLLNRIDGVTFAGAWPRRVRVRLRTRAGLLPATYIDLRSLLKNKRAAGRPRDRRMYCICRPAGCGGTLRTRMGFLALLSSAANSDRLFPGRFLNFIPGFLVSKLLRFSCSTKPLKLGISNL